MFNLKVVISSPLDSAVKQGVLAGAVSRWPFVALPDPGFLARPDVHVLPRQDFLADHAHFAADSGRVVERLLPEWGAGFPSVTFAFIDVSCWGGRCEHRGFVCRSGEVLYRKEHDGDPSGHLTLLEHVGIRLSGNLFVLFWRGYFQAVRA